MAQWERGVILLKVKVQYAIPFLCICIKDFKTTRFVTDIEWGCAVGIADK